VTAIPPRVPTKTSAARKPAKAASAPKATAKPAAKATKKPAVAKAPAKAKPAAKTAVKAAAKPAPTASKKTVSKATKPVSKKAPALSANEALCKQIVSILDTNKGEDISTLNLKNKCSFADYMIVASGRAPRHVAALADYVADMLKKSGNPPLSVEGKESGDWVLIDAGDIIVHIFRPEVRQFYNIEKMWALPAATF